MIFKKTDKGEIIVYHKRRIVYRVIKKKEQMPKPAKGIPLSKAKVHLVLADLVGGISL